MNLPHHHLDRRTLLRGGLALASAIVPALRLPRAAATENAPALARLRLLAHVELEPRQTYVSYLLVGGISGLAWDPEEDLWYALADDPWRPRCYVLRFPGLRERRNLDPTWERVLFLSDRAGGAVQEAGYDVEGLALWRDPRSGERRLLVSNEGGVAYGVPPAVFIYGLDGMMRRELEVPDLLRELGTPGRGPRQNLTFEGVAPTPDGTHAWVSMEGSLLQDESTRHKMLQNGPRRITRFNLATGQADRQVAYTPQPRPRAPGVPELFQVNGISDLLVASEDRLWVLERAFFPLLGFRVRLYEAQLQGATDTLQLDTLTADNHVPASKRLLLDLNRIGLPVVDNFEAMSWGPTLANGNRCVVLATDDNFRRMQTTQFVALEVMPPEPGRR